MDPFQGNHSINTWILNNTFNETWFFSPTNHSIDDESYALQSFCSESSKLYSIFYLIIVGSFALLIIPMTRRYFLCPVDNDNQVSTRHKKMLHYSGLTFVVLTFICLSLAAPTPLLICMIDPLEYQDSAGFKFINLTVAMLYFIQYMSLIFLNFFRLYITFKHTPLRFSKILTCYYQILWVLLCISVVSFLILYGSLDMSKYSILVSFVMYAIFWLLAILTISTCVVFIHKLVQVYKMDASSDEDGKLIRTITKTTILTMISVLITILAYMSSAIGFESHSEIRVSIAKMMSAVDVWSNLICFILTIQTAEMYYNRLCGFCHSNCECICRWMVNRENESIKNLKKDVVDSQTNEVGLKITSKSTRNEITIR